MEDVINFPNVPGYVSVREAASIIGCTDQRIYQYVRSGRISAQRIGHILALPLEEVQNFQPGPAGRQRGKASPWRSYRSRGKLLATSIQVHIHPGMRDKLQEKLKAIKPDEYTFTGNVARYILSNTDTIQILLIWKNTEMPDDTTRQQDLRLFQQAFADVLDWETATYSFDDIWLHT